MAGVGLVAVALGARTLLSEEPGDPRAGSVVVADGADLEPTGDRPLGIEPIEAPPTRRIEYRIEVGPVGDAVVGVDRVLVDRPFASRLESWDGPEAVGDPASVTVAGFGVLRVEGGGEPVVIEGPPAPAPADDRILAGLPAAVEAGAVELREVREVLGRRCRIVRSADPLAVGDLFASPGPDRFTDTCVDGAGLVLEEVSVSEGQRVQRRVATALDLDPEVDPDLLRTGEANRTTQDGGGFVAELVPGTGAPGPFLESEAPAGFDRRGRYAVIPSQPEAFSDPTRRDEQLTFVSDVFVDGIDVVVLDQGGTLGGIDRFEGARGVEVEVALDGSGTRTGLLTFGRGGTVLLVRLDGGRFVRARGTVAPEVLVDLLESLEQVDDGGELTLVEPRG